MNAQLKILEKLSLMTGELAVYKESSILAVVLIEKVTIEPDTVSFTLKPQRGLVIGLGRLKLFTASSAFDYLNLFDGRYTCSIVGWVLETDPVKVIYLSNLIKRNTSIDEVLSAMRKRQAFYSDETTKTLYGLVRLKRLIRNKQILLAVSSDFKGQSWGGAGVMVITNDERTKENYSHFDGVTVISPHASQIGDLFRRIRRIVTVSPIYSHLSKLQFWSALANAANSVKHENGEVSLDQVCEKVIIRAIEIFTQERQ